MNNITNNAGIDEFFNVIMALRHKFNDPSLDLEIKRIATTATVSNRFLIKMEIMSLARDISRVVDLRTFFKDRCEKFIYEGIIHYLDDTAKKDFQCEVNKYGGVYTLGVYTLVVRKAKARYKLNPQVQNYPKAEITHLTKVFQRKEERFYFIKKIKMFFNSPEKMSKSAFENFAISCITTDISATGLAIKIPKQNMIRTKGLLYIWMCGIEDECSFSERVIITYDIKNVFEKNDHIYFNLVYHSKQFSKIIDEFTVYKNNYLHAHKKRNNIPLENTINSVIVKGSEQFIISRLNSLPVFLVNRDGVWLPNAQFKTKNNKQIGLIANKTDNREFLRALCVLPLIQGNLSSGGRFSDHLFVMPITDKYKKTYYIAIPYKEAIGNAYVKKYARIAHHNKQLSLYRIDINETSPEEQCHVPNSLPSSAGDAFENLSQQPIARAKALAKTLNRMLVLSDFSDSIDHLNLLSDQHGSQEEDLQLQDYILKTSAEVVEIFDATAETNVFRKEDRFIYQMGIFIQKKSKRACEFIHCSTINISTRGLKIKLATALNLNVGDHLLVHLPEIAQNGDARARFQPYYVVGKDSELEYRLLITGKAADHDGHKMMVSYIHQNIDTLNAMGNENEIYGLSRVLRNIFANNIHLPHGIAAKNDYHKYINKVAISDNSELPFFAGDNSAEMLNLMNTDAFRSAITSHINITNKDKPYQTLYFVVMPRIRSNGEHYFYVKQVTQAEQNTELIKLLQTLQCIGEPRLLRISATKKNRVFDKYFRDEMSYIERFAVTKIKCIESELKNTMGTFEMADITDLFDYHIKEQ